MDYVLAVMAIDDAQRSYEADEIEKNTPKAPKTDGSRKGPSSKK